MNAFEVWKFEKGISLSLFWKCAGHHFNFPGKETYICQRNIRALLQNTKEFSFKEIFNLTVDMSIEIKLFFRCSSKPFQEFSRTFIILGCVPDFTVYTSLLTFNWKSSAIGYWHWFCQIPITTKFSFGQSINKPWRKLEVNQ